MVLWLGWETADQSGGKDRGLMQDGGWRSCDFGWETADPCWEVDRGLRKERTFRDAYMT